MLYCGGWGSPYSDSSLERNTHCLPGRGFCGRRPFVPGTRGPLCFRSALAGQECPRWLPGVVDWRCSFVPPPVGTERGQCTPLCWPLSSAYPSTRCLKGKVLSCSCCVQVAIFIFTSFFLFDNSVHRGKITKKMGTPRLLEASWCTCEVRLYFDSCVAYSFQFVSLTTWGIW